MPNYDYTCSACEAHIEVFQSMKDAPLRTCPQCGKDTLERQIGTGAGIIFKGSGFYQTDYKKASAPCESSSKEAPSATPTPPKSAGCGGSCACHP